MITTQEFMRVKKERENLKEENEDLKEEIAKLQEKVKQLTEDPVDYVDRPGMTPTGDPDDVQEYYE